MSNSSTWPIDRTLSWATMPDQSESGSDGNEGVLHILQSSSITRTSPSNCLMPYPGHLLSLTLLQGYNVFHSPNQLGYFYLSKAMFKKKWYNLKPPVTLQFETIWKDGHMLLYKHDKKYWKIIEFAVIFL